MVIKTDETTPSRLFIKSGRKDSNSNIAAPNKALKTTKKRAQHPPGDKNSQAALSIGVGKKTYNSADIAKNFVESQAPSTIAPGKDPGLW